MGEHMTRNFRTDQSSSFPQYSALVTQCKVKPYKYPFEYLDLQGRAAVKYYVEPNELLSVACRSGGADDRVRREIQNLYLENDRIRSEISHCDRRARHGRSRLSSTSEDNCWTPSSNTVQRPLTDLETGSMWESVGGKSSAAPSKEDLHSQSLSSRRHRPSSVVGVFESRAMLRAVQNADSLISCKMKQLLTDKDSDLLNALVERALTVEFNTRESKNTSVYATDLSPRKSKSKSSHVNVAVKGHSNRSPCTKVTTVHGEGGGKIKIANVKPLHFLGKRGRRYTDVWNEEDFIHKTKQHHLFRAIHDWSTLISPHSDDHDGAYRDWSIHQSALLVNKIKKGFRNFEASDFGFEYVSPPVPVSTVHPACWGLNARTTANNVLSRTRKKAGDDGRIDRKSCFEIVHPAALCRNLVEPPGHYLEREEFEDIDDISMHAEILVKEMLALEACNYIRLQSLKGYVAVSSQIDSVRSRRTRVQAALAQMYLSDMSVQQTSRRTTYSLTPDPLRAPSETESLMFAAVHAPFAGDDLEPHPHRDATRGAPLVHTAVDQQLNVAEVANTTTRISLPPRHQLGALRLQDVCHGEFLSNCAQGDLIEIFSDGSWRAGCIQNFRFDGHLLRHIKVRHLGSCAGDHVWAAVEDGRLAPPGTHIDNAQFRWLLVSRVPSFLQPDPLDIASMKNADSKSSPRLIAQCTTQTNQGLQSNAKKCDKIAAAHRRGITPSRNSVKLDDGDRMISEANCHGRLNTSTSSYESNTSTGKRSSSGSSSSSSSSYTPPTYPGDEIVMRVMYSHSACQSPSQIISDTLSAIQSSAAVEVGELLMKNIESSAASRPQPPPLPPCHGVPNGSDMGLDAVQSSVSSSTVLQAVTHIPEVNGTEPCDASKPLTYLPFPSVSLTHRARARSEGELGTLRGSDYNQTRFTPFPSINSRPVAPWIPDSAPQLASLPIAAPTLASDTEVSTVSPNILSENSFCENDLMSVGAEEYVHSKEQKAMLSANLVSNGPMIRTVSVLAKSTGVGLDPYRTSSGKVTVASSHVQQHQRDLVDEIKWRDNNIGDDISVVEQSRKTGTASEFEGPCWQKKVHTDRRYSVSETSDSANESQPFKDQRIQKRERNVSQSPTNLSHRVDDTGRRRNRYCNDDDDSRSRSRSRSSGYHEEQQTRRKEREWIRDRDSRDNEDRDWDRCRSRSRGRSRSRSRSHRDSGGRRGSDHGRNGRSDGRRNFSRSRSPCEDAAPHRSWREETLEHNCPLPARDYGQSRFMDMHRVGREKRENRSIEGRARDYDRDYTSTSTTTSVFSAQPSMQRSYSHVQSIFQSCQPMAPQMRPIYHANIPPGSRAPGLTLSVSSIPNPHYHKNYSNSVPAAFAPQPLQVSWGVSEEGLGPGRVAGTSTAAPPFPHLNPQPVHTEQKKNLPSFQSLYG